MSDHISIHLSTPTVFPELNAKEGREANFARDSVKVERMRYGHIKEMQTISPEQQTLWAMQTLTGLSEKDIDQLFAEDAAEITQTIFGFIEKYFTLAKKIWNNPAMEGLEAKQA
jgi:hypothetical protein